MAKKVLLVGGAGYIGSHVALEFDQAGFEVFVYDNLLTGNLANLQPHYHFVHGDILDPIKLHQLLREQDFEVVVHLAALKAAGVSMLEPEAYSRQNLAGTLNLIEAISRSNCRKLIFSSTAAVYGSPRYLPLDEAHPTEPENFYGFTKLEIERFLRWYDQLKGIRFAALRYFNAAGYDAQGRVKGLEREPNNLIPIVMEVLRGVRKELVVFGQDYDTTDGTGVRDYIHVSDLASGHFAAFQHLTQKDASFTVNLGTGQGYSVLQVAAMAEQVSGRQVPLRMGPRRAGDPATIFAKADLAQSLLGWKAKHSGLENLIQTTWQAYQR